MTELILTDSRDRARTGRRTAYKFPVTYEGVHSAWDLVLRDEVPDEYADYISFAAGELHEACETFNDFWAVYGWYLNEYDVDGETADDMDVEQTNKE